MSDDSYIPASNRWNRVMLHQLFVDGPRNTDQWTDWANLTDDELAAVQRFIHSILHKQDLAGSNKPSHTTGTLHAINDPKVAVYKDFGAWHYHCGPRYGRKGHVPTEWWLPANAQGDQSTEVIHYSRKQVNQPAGKFAITIVSFSRQHVPFPDGNDYRNPMGERLRTLGNSIDLP